MNKYIIPNVIMVGNEELVVIRDHVQTISTVWKKNIILN